MIFLFLGRMQLRRIGRRIESYKTSRPKVDLRGHGLVNNVVEHQYVLPFPRSVVVLGSVRNLGTPWYTYSPNFQILSSFDLPSNDLPFPRTPIAYIPLHPELQPMRWLHRGRYVASQQCLTRGS